jgi:hypothetical protein
LGVSGEEEMERSGGFLLCKKIWEKENEEKGTVTGEEKK